MPGVALGSAWTCAASARRGRASNHPGRSHSIIPPGGPWVNTYGYVLLPGTSPRNRQRSCLASLIHIIRSFPDTLVLRRPERRGVENGLFSPVGTPKPTEHCASMQIFLTQEARDGAMPHAQRGIDSQDRVTDPKTKTTGPNVSSRTAAEGGTGRLFDKNFRIAAGIEVKGGSNAIPHGGGVLGDTAPWPQCKWRWRCIVIVRGLIECPVCGRPFRAWFQPGVKTLLCPTCGTELDTTEAARQPERTPISRRAPGFARVFELIRGRRVGYNGNGLAN